MKAFTQFGITGIKYPRIGIILLLPAYNVQNDNPQVID